VNEALAKGPIVAVGDPWHDAAYAVFERGRLRHVEVERLTRSKYEMLNPLLAGCLMERETFLGAGCFLFEEGRFLAPLVRELRNGTARSPHGALRRIIGEQHGSIPAELLESLDGCIDDLALIFSGITEGRVACEVMDHHFCHAANAFLSSDFDHALVFTLDGGGTHLIGGQPVEVHGSVYEMRRTAPLSRSARELVTGWSPGWAWTRACNVLGLDSYDAGTLMAMAAYGARDARIGAIVRNDTFWAVHSGELSRFGQGKLRLLLKALAGLVEEEPAKFALALELQVETERRIREFMRAHLEHAGRIDVCLSGGTFLNCIAAAKIPEWFGNVQRLYVPPVPYDAGISLGLAQAYLFDRGLGTANDRGTSCIAAFAGEPRHTIIDIYAACRSIARAEPSRVSAEELAAKLSRGSVIGLFQGGSESGRRALGNRSIVCDPRDAKNREKLNRLIKKRAWFRPFAPIVLAEEACTWFEVDERFSSPYMSFAPRFRAGKGDFAPAVRHADDTARVQTVHRELTPRTHELLSAWHSLTGVPMLLNTSFNDTEPIVETPAQAVATMLRSGLDGLYFAEHGLFLDMADAKGGD
jgi:carbamoyltransferase